MLVPPFASGGSSDGDEPDPLPEVPCAAFEDFELVSFLRAGGEIGSASPAAATRASPVTHTGV
jgi:hypothetical protein